MHLPPLICTVNIEVSCIVFYMALQSDSVTFLEFGLFRVALLPEKSKVNLILELRSVEQRNYKKKKTHTHTFPKKRSWRKLNQTSDKSRNFNSITLTC